MLSINKIRHILYLALVMKLESAHIARSVGVAHNTVNNYLRRVKDNHISFEKIDEMDDETLLGLLVKVRGKDRSKQMPNFPEIHKELQNSAVTLELLHIEYKEAYGSRDYGLARVCDL